MAATPHSALRRPAARVRWDRVGRVALLLVLLGVIALYINPLRTYVSTWQEKGRRTAELTQLERENAALRARQRELHDPVALEREARRLGMLKPGERAFVVDGLPKGR